MAAMTCGRLCLPASAATTCAAAPLVARAARQLGLGVCEAARCALPGAPVERAAQQEQRKLPQANLWIRADKSRPKEPFEI